jgi:formylglycine-generating enzyme required for sulfatase activity
LSSELSSEGGDAVDESISDSQISASIVDSQIESELDSGVGESQLSTADGRASAVDSLGLGSDASSDLSDDSSAGGAAMPAPSNGNGGLAIHDALTALKLHPRPDLVEDPVLRDALTRTAGTATNSMEPPALPPEPDDADDVDDSMSPTVTRGPSAMPAPLPAPPAAFGAQVIDDMAPQRPVTPPRKPTSSAPNPLAIAAGVGIAVLVLLLGGRALFKKPGVVDDDGATVTVQPPVAAVVDAGNDDTEPTPAVAVDAGTAVASTTKPPLPTVVDPNADANERAAAEQRAREEMERREREAAAAAAAAGTGTPPKPDDTKVAVAEAGACPAGMARIDGGSFSFGSSGSDPMRNFGELDAKTVEVKSYCIDYYEAPNGAKTLPTTGVSWTAAKNTCERGGKRLCSEVEWERACKGPGSSRFPYGNTYDAESCNTEDADAKARPLARPVDFKKCRSAFKVYMMAGNAEEWTADAVGSQRVAKGGSSDRPDFASRCSARRPLSPKTASGMLGFRCCADPG